MTLQDTDPASPVAWRYTWPDGRHSYYSEQPPKLVDAKPLYLHPPAPAVGAEDVARLLEEARDMLMERIYGNPARSPGHNARLKIEKAISLLSGQGGGK